MSRLRTIGGSPAPIDTSPHDMVRPKHGNLGKKSEQKGENNRNLMGNIKSRKELGKIGSVREKLKIEGYSLAKV